jgi:hypothetical protein
MEFLEHEVLQKLQFFSFSPPSREGLGVGRNIFRIGSKPNPKKCLPTHFLGESLGTQFLDQEQICQRNDQTARKNRSG